MMSITFGCLGVVSLPPPQGKNKDLVPMVGSCSKVGEKVIDFSFHGGPVGENASCSLVNTNSKNHFLIFKEN